MSATVFPSRFESLSISDAMYDPVGLLSELVGASEPAIRLIISLFFGYPVALFHRKYLYGKAPNLQYLYFIFTGFGLGYFNYGVEIFHAVFAVLFTYLTVVIFGGSVVSVGITFVFNMGYLLIGYYYSGTEGYDINWTVPQCVLVLRLIGISFDLLDGRQPLERLSADSKKVALIKMPTFLEFCGHMFFPTSFLIGPQFPMKRLQEFVAGEYGEKPIEPKRSSTTINSKDCLKPPNSVDYALRRFITGVFYLSVYQVISMSINDEYIISDEYNEQPFLKKCFFLGVWGRITLYKYISCWLFAEGACILFGVSHNGKDESGTVLWNGLENVKLHILENTTEFNHYIQAFNVNTNHWVAQYIYKRLKFLGNRYVSQASALLFLAIWHGFHSGYYICFLFEFLVMYLEKDLQSILKTNEAVTSLLHKQPVSLILNILLRIYTFVFMGWCLLPFVLLSYDKYWKAYGAVNYMGVFLYIPWPIFYSPIVRLLLGKRTPRRVAVD